ncbi:MAG: D-alanine--D-alanine ligase family protein [Acidimicrobiia bacterium]
MTRVLLLFGGRSAEHEVSCTSAVAIGAALGEAGLQVVPVGIDRDGGWWLADTGERPYRAAGRAATLELPRGVIRSSGDEIGFDVMFPVLHGPFGEDGTVQGVFETAGIPYVGCGVKASAVAMDKDFAKRMLRDAGIEVGRWRTVRTGDSEDAPRVVDDLIADLGLPVFVKPAELGSSVGVSKAATDAELKDGITRALEYGPKVVVEEAIRGREIEVSVIDGPQVSMPGEVVIETEWYDYDAKYHDESSRFEAPANLTEPETQLVRSLAGRVFEAIECRGLARIDFFYERPGRGFLLNEINTMPGFTPISGFPKMWEASGLSYPDLCGELVEAALAT